ncbi:flagellar biosynthetic protein FliO [Noviherbaspirillum autotrophicum]|uniref:Flagellar protein n=1 Tax=Noviherbaspirillum autotrophicum TaxID=709839 RepID=A0A0C1YNH7_9BURK|nr:flagellar biosynthetic protein FliO [Noviherbaspirillum autotrophicum]KIF82152.1 flagellar assembly protein FliO [Noviherbaspirillum autotrophicum]
MMQALVLPLLLCAGGVAHAAEQTGPGSAASLLQVLLGLVVVLGLLAGTAWTIRRLGLAKPSTASVVKIVGGASIGTRERIVLVEVADQWIVVGVAPGCINALSTMPRQEGYTLQENMPPMAKNFSAWLKQTIDKRNAQ